LEKRLTIGAYQFKNATMADLAEFLNAGLLNSALGERLVVDQTGLTGRYDFELKLSDMPVSPNASDEGKMSLANSVAASIPSALQSLGLKLQSQRAMVEFLIIDAVDRPSQN
jgi:uncharacterized protein (TIGR03435 family)